MTFITHGNFISPRWQQAFPNAKIRTNSDVSSISCGELVWVLSGITDWLEIVQSLSLRGCNVIVMSRDPSTSELREALIAGAKGYLEALASGRVFQQAGDVVANGSVWLPSTLVTGLVGVLSSALEKQQTEQPDLSMLTKRERQVALEVTTGLLNKEVADKLDITERTVKAHLAAVFEKLGVRDRVQLMLKVRGN